MATINPDAVVLRLDPVIKQAVEAGVYQGLVDAAGTVSGLEHESVREIADYVVPQVVQRIYAALGLD